MNEPLWHLGRIAHDAYVREVSARLIIGGELPHWDQLTPDLRFAWVCVAETLLRTYTKAGS